MSHVPRSSVTAALLLALAAPAHAAPGDLDPTFGQGGIVILAPSANTIGGYVASLADGDVVIGATASDPTRFQFPDRTTIVVARLHADGTLDPHFGDGGIAYRVFEPDTDPLQSGLSALAAQPDGRILLAGGSTDRVAGMYRLGVMRLLPDGTLDPAFGDAGLVLREPLPGERITNLLIEPDGCIVVGGDVAIEDRRQLILHRLDPDGAVDGTFGLAGSVIVEPAHGLSNQLEALVRWPDGSIGVVGVAFDDDASGTPMGIATRLGPDGRVDDGFGTAGAVVIRNGEWPTDAALTADGRLVMVTVTFTVGPSIGTLRLLPNGGLDPSFGVDGFAHFSFPGPVNANALLLDAEGRVLIGGAASPDENYQYALGLVRLTSDGFPDLAFGIGGKVLTPVAETADIVTMALRPDGGIVVGGFADTYQPARRHVIFAARYDTEAGSTCMSASGRLLLRRLGAPDGDEQMQVAATIGLDASAAIDPVATGVRVMLQRSDGTPLLDVAAPAGALDTVSGVGWRARHAGGPWSFVDSTAATGIRSLHVRRLGPNRLRVAARLRRSLELIRETPPMRVVVAFPEACGILDFPTDRCTGGTSTEHLVCR